MSDAIREVVLVGGGHAHAIVLRQFGLHPSPHLRLTLVSDVEQTPYSGMLPGHVAGFYDFEDCHIDLKPLAEFAGARFVRGRASGVDLQENILQCDEGRSIPFDNLSLDIGSTPATVRVPGAMEHAIPAKPVSHFLQHWYRLLETVKANPQQPLSLGIVGGGAGGVELALNVRSRLHRMLQQAGQSSDTISQQLQLHLFHRGSELMSGHAPVVRRRLQRLLVRYGVRLHLNESVVAVKPGVEVVCESGLQQRCDRLFWVTQASAPSWLAASGLATDEAGFVLVGDTLQSLSHPQIFAAGDIATMKHYPRPKAGVFAVRQGQPLFENLRRLGNGESLRPYVPQKQILALIGTGDGRAIASRGSWGLGPWRLLWWWKDWIDRRFMTQFEGLSGE
ncbi:FAD-dependent oxidoreductase [Baaleninema sp.]|uniref:FAD-dependent oxidoreductase n=1 Tax=Baaleninema sp. TaxID=3101197 RepID=UPI003D003986